VEAKTDWDQAGGLAPAQRKTTLKWDTNGELTSIDMARVVDRLTQPELKRCDLVDN
tara:strand:+ start:481 stop:648 length:168 start_codon:yes stop_codon:yes gene_type:complete